MTEIQKENNNMSKVPNLRFPGFEGEWETKKLGDLLEFKNGINATKEQYGSGYKFINVLDILNNEFITHEKIIGSVNVNEDIINKFPVNYGDILFQRSSETREEVGTTSVYLDKDKTATFGGFVIRGKKIGDYEPVFLNKLLKIDSIRNQITSKSGGSTRYNVGQEILASVNLLSPSLIEQQKIASFLSLIDSRIQTQNKIIEELKLLKTSIAKKIFSQELRFKDENGNDLSEWEDIYLENVCEIKKGEQFNKENLQEIGLYPCLNGGIFPSGFSEKYNTTENTITISEGGNSCGFVNFMTTKFWLGGHCYKISLSHKTHLIYFYQLLKFNEQSIMNLRVGSGLPNIQMRSLKKFIIQISSSDKEQTKIANFLSSIDSKIDIETQLLQKLGEQKKFLLQQMFV